MITENEADIERSLNQCTVDMFDKLTSAELSDFIWAHDPNVLMKKDIPTNKGKLEDAKYALEHSSTANKNRILMLSCAGTNQTNSHHCMK